MEADMLSPYEQEALRACMAWKEGMTMEPNLYQRVSKRVQVRINRLYPEKVHKAISMAIKQLIRAVIFGADFTNKKPVLDASFADREARVMNRIRFYTLSSAAEGAATGAGGILLGLADFPLWLSLKMKMLFEIAALYGFSTKDYQERLFLLFIFQLTFSSQKQRIQTFRLLEHWDEQSEFLPRDIHAFDWKTFQIEYRDYLDLAKLFQLIPGFGAVVGGLVNHRLTQRLGTNAMNAYRLRLLAPKGSLSN